MPAGDTREKYLQGNRLMENVELGTIIAIMGSTFTIIATTISLFLWMRSEANNDRRHIQEIQREDRKDLLQLSRNLETTILAIQQEIKEFHNRLCAIEQGKK